jgi:lipoprotein-anchoring transpeptidase ErfK/SrfK
MRRHTAIPVKASAVAVLIMAGAAYMAAEARQTIIRKRQLEIVQIERLATVPTTQIPLIAQSGPNAVATAPAIKSRPQADELAAERQAASIPAEKPNAVTNEEGHRRQIVISIADRRLALLEDGKLVKTYPIAVGARVSPSPEGEFAVINHAVRPTYRHGGKEILPGKDNPLGTRWIGLSLKGYGIHGTNVPSSIGKAASHGCFRMGQADVEDLYSRVQVGDAVTVRRERDELIARIFAAPATTRTEEVVASNATSTIEAAE